MKIPGFNAEASLYKTYEGNHRMLIALIDSMQVLLQSDASQTGRCRFQCYGDPWKCDVICDNHPHSEM